MNPLQFGQVHVIYKLNPNGHVGKSPEEIKRALSPYMNSLEGEFPGKNVYLTVSKSRKGGEYLSFAISLDPEKKKGPDAWHMDILPYFFKWQSSWITDCMHPLIQTLLVQGFRSLNPGKDITPKFAKHLLDRYPTDRPSCFVTGAFDRE